MERDPRTLSIGVRERRTVERSTVLERLRELERFDTTRTWWLALGTMLLVGAGFLYYETRGTTFWYDEWTWALTRRGSSLATFLDAHNGHLSLVPVVIYKLLFATAGLRHYAPYRIVVIAAQLGCVALLFAYAIRRVEGFLAFLAAALLLFFGPGWQEFLWPFQVAWLISLGSGVAALLMLDRDDLLGRALACGLVAVSLASSSVGVAVAAGVLVDVLCRPRGWRAAWVVGGPLALYALWSLGYQTTTITDHGIEVAPGFAAQAAATTMSALLGLGGDINPAIRGYAGTLLEWGPPLAVAASVIVIWRLLLLRRAPVRRCSPIRVFALLATVAAFWLLTGLVRWWISTPYDSRYLYVGALFVLLLAVELTAGSRVAWPARIAIGVLGLAALISNVGNLRTAAGFLRSQAQLTRAQVGSLDIARQIVPPSFGTGPFGIINAGQYFSAERAIGSPAATPAQIATFGEPAREAADAELAGIHGVRLRPLTAPPALGARPTLDGASGGTVVYRGSCENFTPAVFSTPGAASAVSVTVPASGLRVSIGDAPATVSFRRFGQFFQPLGALAPHAQAELLIGADLAPQPWHLQISSTAAVSVCGLAS